MSKNFHLIIVSLLFSTLLHAQMIGGTGPGDPSPREVSAGGINVGTVSNSVNSFTGTLDLSHTLGTVSTVSGPSFTLSMSYSSSIMSGGIQQDMKGAPFGDGWSLNIPRISVSIEDLEKYNECQRDYFNSPSNSNNSRGNMFYTPREIRVEGDLYWFDPTFSIPGVGSGRLVYKYSRGSYHYFVPQNFESPVEFRMSESDFVWIVTTANGDKYTFSPYPTYRQASQIRIHPSSFNMDAHGGFFYGRYYKDIVKPKIEIAEWVCKSITNSMSVERITFKYQYYGDMINMFQQFDQACFEESPHYEMPKMYQGYILDQISSTLDILDLEYGNLYEDETQNCDEDDLFFCKELIYDSQTTDSGDKWMRYKHAASVSLSGTGLSSNDGFHNSSDPYRSSSFGYRLDEPETLGAAFNHGWLESPRLSSNKFTEGDYYEVAVDINNNSSNLFFDINIASGDNLNAPAAPSSFPPTGTGQLAGYTDTRGWSLHSTFSNPVKWYDRAPGFGIDRTFKTTFLMPKLLDENGIYIQIGPANSDNSFDMPPNVVHWDGIRGPGYNIFDASGSAFPFASYFNYYPAVSGNLLGGEHVGTPEEFGTGNEGLGLYPTDPMPSKFGVGLPWHMMLPFYGREIQGGTFTNIPDL